jgi:hypothetical protein
VTGPFAPRELARQVCERSAGLFRWPTGLADLRDAELVQTPHAWSARMIQEFKGLPVDASEVVVNVTSDGRVQSVYNQYHYDVPPDLDPARIRIGAVEARQLVARLAAACAHREIGPPVLIVIRYEPRPPKDPPPRGRPARRRRPSARARLLLAVKAALAAGRRRRPREGTHVLAWDVRLTASRPPQSWRFLVDAMSGALLEARDLAAYARPRGKVFDPNPIVTSGDMTLSSRTATAKLNAQQATVDLERLDPPPADGRLRLDGAWVHIVNMGDPDPKEPSSAGGSFSFSSASPSFLDVMVYFHIDRFQQYIQTDLALPEMGNTSVAVDPQLSTTDGSNTTGAGIGLGEDAVPDASDAMIILHEYGHFLQNSVLDDSSEGNFPSGVSEGFADFLAAVYYDDKHARPEKTRGIMFSWNANAGDKGGGRRYDMKVPDEPAWDLGGGYDKGALWCATTFELYRKLGGDSTDADRRTAARDLAIRLHLLGYAHVPIQNATIPQMAQAIEAADWNLGGWRYPDGLHRKVIQEVFAGRSVGGYAPPAVDVYVDDGRAGRYGTADGTDDFEKVLWKEDHRDAPDVWVRTVATPGTPADHAGQVPAEAPAFVFARVKNRGAAASGPITARAFSSGPGSARRWPADWTELPAPPGPMPATVAAAGGAGVIVGPFPWTPARPGKHALLVVIESGDDRAVTQDLPAGAQVGWMDLVPFDNNLAVREVRARRA